MKANNPDTQLVSSRLLSKLVDYKEEQPHQEHRPRLPHEQGALRKCFEDAYCNVTHDKDTRHAQTFADGSTEFLKTASLFVPGAWGRVASAAVYAADEPIAGDSHNVPLDLICGAGKGLFLRRLNELAAVAKINPLVQGASLGLATRVTQVALSRKSYIDPSTHQASGWQGLQSVSKEINNTDALVTDLSMFAASKALAGVVDRVVDPAWFQNRPHLAASIAGASFGVMGGAVQEIKAQQAEKHSINWQKVAFAAAAGGANDAVAANIGSRLGRVYAWNHQSSAVRNAVGSRASLSRSGEGFDETSSTGFKGAADNVRTNGSSDIRTNGSSDNNKIDRQNGFRETHGSRTTILRQFTRVPLFERSGLTKQEQQLLQIFGRRLSVSGIDGVPQAFQNIHRKVRAGQLHPESVDNIYASIGRLFESKTLPQQVAPTRTLLAKQLLMQVGDPRLVQQGTHPTCTVAALEHRMFTRDPDKAVSLVVEAAVRAQYEAPHGYRGQRFTVELNKSTLAPEHAIGNPYDLTYDGMYRSYPSQIFQYVVPNIHWQSKEHNRRYDRSPRIKEYAVMDSADKQKIKRLYSYPHLGPSETTDLYEAITGSGTQFHFTGDRFTSLQHFKERVMKAQSDNQMPLILSIDGTQSPFKDIYEKTNEKPLQPDEGVHDICLTGYNARTNNATVYNSWGRQFHANGIDLDVLYKALYRARGEKR